MTSNEIKVHYFIYFNYQTGYLKHTYFEEHQYDRLQKKKRQRDHKQNMCFLILYTLETPTTNC